MTNEEIRKHLSIIEDHDEDKDDPVSYFCQVYADEDQEVELDSFCIRKSDVEKIDDYTQAEKFAIDYVKECLPSWIDDYNANKSKY
ncbi:MAG: hypothetical protein K6F00_11110 [Lachnospiraceae bacterium]|nr:hypothetical protein [Lachnospiraceae bacterium]